MTPRQCAEDRVKATADTRRRLLVCSVRSTVSVCAVCEKIESLLPPWQMVRAAMHRGGRRILKQVDAQMCSQQQSCCPACLYFKISQVFFFLFFFAQGTLTIRGIAEGSGEKTKPGRGVK